MEPCLHSQYGGKVETHTREILSRSTLCVQLLASSCKRWFLHNYNHDTGCVYNIGVSSGYWIPGSIGVSAK